MLHAVEKHYEQFVLVLSLVGLVVLMFGPLVAISFYATGLELTTTNAEVTVGIAVLFRATARRLLRASFQNILRTTFGTVSRAFARTATRRFVRIFAHSFFGAIAKRTASDDGDANATESYSTVSSLIAAAVGFIGLSLSFWGVLFMAGNESSSVASTFATVSTLQMCLLAGLPILVYCLVTFLAAKLFGVEVSFVTSLDGLLIQGYFTGAGSFLPMTTDVNYEGDNVAKAKLATVALGSLLAVHWILYAISVQTGLSSIQFAAAMFVVFAFVYTFPISPLEGHDIWRVSKLWWAAIFAPTLISFLKLFPNELAGLL